MIHLVTLHQCVKPVNYPHKINKDNTLDFMDML